MRIPGIGTKFTWIFQIMLLNCYTMNVKLFVTFVNALLKIITNVVTVLLQYILRFFFF